MILLSRRTRKIRALQSIESLRSIFIIRQLKETFRGYPQLCSDNSSECERRIHKCIPTAYQIGYPTGEPGYNILEKRCFFLKEIY